MELVTIDEAILESLRGLYFGDLSDKYLSAIDRAYRDMNRTIRFKSVTTEEREKIRKKVTLFLKHKIEALCMEKEWTQEKYDNWHFNICKQICNEYNSKYVEFYFGQAQKWLNMSMKYLYLIGVCSFEEVFEYLHAPVDNYVFDVAEKKLGISKPKVAWSRWDDYQNQYMKYQYALREHFVGENLLRWEFEHWLKEARNG